MAKTYPQQLVDWVKQRDSPRRDRNVVSFLAVRDDVKIAIEAGFAVRTVWKNMCEAGRIDFGYDTFLKYVRRLERSEAAKQEGAIDAAPRHRVVERKRMPKKASPATTASGAEPIRGFSFNPSANKEDLI